MRQCTRCLCWKPNANFAKADNVSVGAKQHARCLHCRTIRSEVHERTAPPPATPRLAPSLHATLLRSLARAEFAAFLTRGARTIPRPYVHDATGAVMNRHASAGWDLTGPAMST